MSRFTWHDNHNLDYGGIAQCEINWNINQLQNFIVIAEASNDNTIVWHRRRNRDDAEAMTLYRFLDDTVAMESDR
jgi:hypothetical protein